LDTGYWILKDFLGDANSVLLAEEIKKPVWRRAFLYAVFLSSALYPGNTPRSLNLISLLSQPGCCGIWCTFLCYLSASDGGI
jgi:hypothetical protein